MADADISLEAVINGPVRGDGLIFYSGRWRSRWSIEKARARERRLQIADPERSSEFMRRARAAKPEQYWLAARKYRATPNGRAYGILQNARARCRKYGGELTIDKAWLLDRIRRGVCEVTGIPFDLGPCSDAHYNPWGPSLDQIEPGRGYTPENSQLVCNVHNSCKNEWSEAVHRRYIEACARKYGLIK